MQEDSSPAWPLWFRLGAPLAVAWAQAPTIPAWCLVASGSSKFGPEHTGGALTFVSAISLAGMAMILEQSRRSVMPAVRRYDIALLIAAASCSLSLAMSRALLPFESPMDGTGSPVPVLINITLYTVVGASFGSPAAIFAIVAAWIRKAVFRRGCDKDQLAPM